MNFLITGILSQPWAIEQNFVQSNIGLIASFLKGSAAASVKDIEFSTRYVIEPGASAPSGKKTPFDQAPYGSIAVINLSGPLMKNDQFCGPVGTATIAEWAKAIDNNPNFIGAIVKSDTPGGSVAGTEELARVFASTKKPFVAFVDGLTASAGYWAISGCNEIIAGGQTSTIGSIGVMCTIADFSKALEMEGITLHELYATNSSAKNKSYRDAIGGDYAAITAELDALNVVFENTIRTNRSHVKIKDAVFNGATYLSTEAKKMGLIDRIGTMDDAIASVKKLSKKQNTMNTNNAQAVPAITALLGWEDGFEATEDGVHFQMEDLNTLNEALVKGNEAIIQLGEAQGALAAKASEATAAIEKFNTATQTIETLNATIAELNGKPVHTGSNTLALGEEETESTKVVSKYVPDGSEKIAERHGLNTKGWFE